MVWRNYIFINSNIWHIVGRLCQLEELWHENKLDTCKDALDLTNVSGGSFAPPQTSFIKNSFSNHVTRPMICEIAVFYFLHLLPLKKPCMPYKYVFLRCSTPQQSCQFLRHYIKSHMDNCLFFIAHLPFFPRMLPS